MTHHDDETGRYRVTPDDGSAPYDVVVTRSEDLYHASDGTGLTGINHSAEEAIGGLHDGAVMNGKRTGRVKDIVRL